MLKNPGRNETTTRKTKAGSIARACDAVAKPEHRTRGRWEGSTREAFDHGPARQIPADS